MHDYHSSAAAHSMAFFSNPTSNNSSPIANTSGSEGSVGEQTATSLDFSPCEICHDRATGNHYGAISCDGCKGFFRRSIRKDHNYKCRFQQNCNVDKTHRNACRACRLRRCMQAGMRSSAIQNERDVIGKRRKLDSECDNNGQFLKGLLQSESYCMSLRETVIKRTEQIESQVEYDKGKIIYDGSDGGAFATLNDVGNSINQQLSIIVEWAKSLTPFKSICLTDQANLLRANAASLIVLGVAFRSLGTNGGVHLANEKILSMNQAMRIGDINLVVGRIIRELVEPMREHGLDETDFVALKAALFFNPYCIKGEPHTTSILKNARLMALKVLKNNKPDDEDCRFGQLLLLSSAVHSIAQQLVEDVQLCRLFQLTHVDELMTELILNEEKSRDSTSRAVIEKLKATS